MDEFSGFPVHDPEALHAIARDTAPEVVPRLVEVFLKEGQRRRDAILRAHADGDVETLAREAHALKSAAASYGCARLAAQARSADAAYKAGDLARVLALAPLMVVALEEAEAALRFVRMGE
jgi:HPt (histidine-containing phosphotransfer) domain-containing protein